MNSRERMLTALDHKEPDRVPVDLWFTSEVEALLSARCDGLRGPELRVALGHDLLMTSSPNIGASYELPGTPAEYICDWGVHWRWVTNAEGGRYTEAVRHPLADARKLSSYVMPHPLCGSNVAIYAETRDLVARFGGTHAIFGSLYQTVFEAAWLLRGMQALLADMAMQKDFAHELFERLTQYSIVAGRALVKTGVDVVWLGDDFGTQAHMLISPRMWREFIKERYARIIAALKKLNPRLKIAYHCDGAIEPIIPDLIDIGLDVLNPVQPLSMNPGTLKRQYGQSLSFWGTVDVQRTFPFGSTAQVAREVRARIETMAPGGGFILCSAHRVQPGTPLANIEAYYEAARAYGSYPVGAGRKEDRTAGLVLNPS